MRDGKGRVARQFFSEDGRGDLVETRAAVFLRNRAAEQTDFSRFLQHLRHQSFFVRFELRHVGQNFFLNKFLSSLADQALVVRNIGGSKDVLGAGGRDEKRSSAIESLGNRCRGHDVPCLLKKWGSIKSDCLSHLSRKQ